MLDVYTLEQSEQWDAVVRSFKDHDVYYLSGYVKAFQTHGDGEPLLVFYQNEDIRGINVVMKRDVAGAGGLRGKIERGVYFDLATPYGYGGWLIEGNDTNGLFKTYADWCLAHNVVSEFVRYHPVLENHAYSANYYQVVALGETVAIDTTDKDAIWANFDSKNRNVIRKAIKNGVEIKKGLSEELLNKFIELYNQTMDKDNADQYYYFEKEFYQSILNDLNDHAVVFYAALGETIVAASIILYANGRLNYHLSGSLRAYQHLAPSNLLLWKAAEWGNEIGCGTFHLGGGRGSSEDSLFKFKKAFYRGELCRYHIGKKIFNEKIYQKLVALSSVSDSSFFPHYRGKR